MSERDFSAVQVALRPDLKDLSSSDPQAVLIAMLLAIGEGRFADLAQHFTDDTELHIYGFPAINGSWHGVAAVVAAMAANFSLISQQKSTVEGMIRQGDALAIKIRETGKLTGGHSTHLSPYLATGVIWFTFFEGKIRRVEEYLQVVLQPGES